MGMWPVVYLRVSTAFLGRVSGGEHQALCHPLARGPVLRGITMSCSLAETYRIERLLLLYPDAEGDVIWHAITTLKIPTQTREYAGYMSKPCAGDIRVRVEIVCLNVCLGV